jgi:hypothetical protein
MMYIKDCESISYQNVDEAFHYLLWTDAGVYTLETWHGVLHKTERGHQIIGPTNLAFWSAE